MVVVGAGLSGVGLAATLRRRRPEDSLAVLESRGALGGTWDLFRYPGVRSDSDMFTFAYRDHPWTGERSLAAGGAIRDDVADVARRTGVEALVRYRHRLVAAGFSTADARWTLTVERTGDDGDQEVVTLTASFLVAATGYYRYDRGYTPELPGLEGFDGRVVHPQAWPDDLDVSGLRVVVVGSGATAVTLVPALTGAAEHVTMLQRSPGYDLDVDVAPEYDPWDQRLCVVPDGDLFAALRGPGASVVTDRIETFTSDGVRLASGAVLPADVVVTATGLSLQLFGGAALSVDGERVDVPATVVPTDPPTGGLRPLLDLDAGYVRRGSHLVPRTGPRSPWRVRQSYLADLVVLRWWPLRSRRLTLTGTEG